MLMSCSGWNRMPPAAPEGAVAAENTLEILRCGSVRAVLQACTLRGVRQQFPSGGVEKC